MFDTLVVTTVTRWDEPPRIRHQLTLEMQKYFKNIIFIETPKRTTQSEVRYKHQLRQVASNIYAYRMPEWYALPRNIHGLLPVVSRLHQNYVLKTAINLLKEVASNRAFLFNFNFSDYGVHDKNIFSFSSFILNDNFIDRVNMRLARYYVKKKQVQTIRRADLCLVVSTPLLSQVQKYNENTALLLPGHNFDCSIEENASLSFYSNNTRERLRVCFMGYINYRLELDWIKHVAKHGAIDFYLLGPIELPSKEIFELKSNGVIFLPSKNGSDLKDFLASCHVLTIPYNVAQKSVQAIEASNKLFQYIASGRPIVASLMPNLLNLPDYVLTKVNSKEAFLEKIIHVANNDTLKFYKARLQIASENTWEKRGINVIQLIEQTLNKF